MIRARTLAFVLMALPASCQTTSSVISDYCEIFRPIRPSRTDTPGTLAQVLRENAKYREFCAVPPGTK